MALIPPLNDGSSNPPRLGTYLCVNTLLDQPEWGSGPRGSDDEVIAALKEAGFEGLQNADPTLCHKHGVRPVMAARIDSVEEAHDNLKRWRDEGYDAATVHMGTGYEDDATVDTLVAAMLEQSAAQKFPIYLETHRATITQDAWRTVQLVGRFPELRINGDFSHYYTGGEMVYGPIEKRFEFLEPVFDRVRFMHGRIGNTGHVQMPISADFSEPFIAHFREFWTRSMRGFLAEAGPGDVLPFSPEILPARWSYAHMERQADGSLREPSDRYAQAFLYIELAKQCWAEASKG